MWNYEHIIYTDGSTWDSIKRIIGTYGNKGDTGDTGATGNAGPEAVVTIIPSNVDWNAGTATLTAILRVNGQIVTPTSYAWTQGISTSLGNSSSININNLNTTYNCTVTW